MAQEEEVPELRILPPTRRPILPEEEGYVPPVRTANDRKRSSNPSHTIAVGTQVYALLLHQKHALEVVERRLVSFGEVIESLIEDRRQFTELQEKIAARRAAKAAKAAEEEE